MLVLLIIHRNQWVAISKTRYKRTKNQTALVYLEYLKVREH